MLLILAISQGFIGLKNEKKDDTGSLFQYSNSVSILNQLNSFKTTKIDDVVTWKWLNYGIVRDSTNNGTAVIHGNYLFPDSSVYAIYDSVYKRIKIHSIGNVLDPYSTDMIAYYNTLLCSKGFNVEKLAITYKYIRNHPDTSIHDTLIVSLYLDSVYSNLEIGFLTDSISPSYQVDTIKYRKQKYDSLNNMADAIGKVVYKFLLKKEDESVNIFKTKNLSSVNLWIPDSFLLASTLSFKPGYTYNPGDTITKNKNAFLLGSYEEFGPDTFPTYSPTDWNVSSILTSGVRYGLDSIWTGLYTPTYAFDSTYVFEHHLIHYYIQAGCFGIDELDEVNYTRITKLHPNPTSSKIRITYLLKEESQVSFTVRNIQGVQMIYEPLNISSSGSHDYTLNLNSLTPGIYFLQLNASGKYFTRKLVVF